MSAIPFPSHLGWGRSRAALGAQTRSAPAVDQPPTLVAGERILSRQQTDPANAIVATDQAAHLRADGRWRRIAWTEVEAAGWDPVTSRTVLTLWPDAADVSAIWVPTSRRMAAFVSERVMSTQVLRRQVRVSPNAVATVLGLRRAGADGLQWRVLVHGDGADEEHAKAAADQALAEIRALAGA